VTTVSLRRGDLPASHHHGNLPASHRLPSSSRAACPPGSRAGKSWPGATGAGRSHSFVALHKQNGSREQDFRGSIPGAASLHPVWEGSARRRSWSSFWSPPKGGLTWYI
jgi:hypothetical protein